LSPLHNNAVDWLPNDLGGVQADAFRRIDHPMQPWEKRCHALADVLDAHKIISTEEKRRGVEALGADSIAKLAYYERWTVCFANLLFAKRLLTPEELARKMSDVSSRFPGSAVDR
jgi:hypothetical protein